MANKKRSAPGLADPTKLAPTADELTIVIIETPKGSRNKYGNGTGLQHGISVVGNIAVRTPVGFDVQGQPDKVSPGCLTTHRVCPRDASCCLQIQR